MKKIFVSDITLYCMYKQRSERLLFREKLKLAAAIEGFGADCVELQPIQSVKEDTIINQTLARTLHGVRLTVPAGDTEQSIKEAYESIKAAQKPCLQIRLPVSTVNMEYSYHLKNEKMLLKISELVKLAAGLCEQTEFVALDASRAEPLFLIQALKTAELAGATCVTVADEVGSMLPEETASIICDIKKELTVPVYVQISNAYSMAPALSIAAVMAGADGVKTAVGCKAALDAAVFSDYLTARGEEIGCYSRLKSTQIQTDISRLLKLTAEEISLEQANTEDGILLDSQSTLPQTVQAVRLMGYDLSEEDFGKVYSAMQTVCERKGSVGNKELEAIIASYAMQAPSTYHVKSYVITSGNITAAMAHIVLMKNGEEIEGMSIGDGPIDAAFHAIENCVGHHYELDSFQIEAVTEGKEALGSTLVRLRNAGKLYSGNGLSTDIVGAGVRAYVNALNKIVAGEESL